MCAYFLGSKCFRPHNQAGLQGKVHGLLEGPRVIISIITHIGDFVVCFDAGHIWNKLQHLLAGETICNPQMLQDFGV